MSGEGEHLPTSVCQSGNLVAQSNSEQQDWPTYVRVLAVLHVLSIPIGFIGFLVLSMRAGWIGAHRQFGLEFWTVTLSAFGWMGLCARYRRWFENWGRKRWPDGKPTACEM